MIVATNPVCLFNWSFEGKWTIGTCAVGTRLHHFPLPHVPHNLPQLWIKDPRVCLYIKDQSSREIVQVVLRGGQSQA